LHEPLKSQAESQSPVIDKELNRLKDGMALLLLLVFVVAIIIIIIIILIIIIIIILLMVLLLFVYFMFCFFPPRYLSLGEENRFELSVLQDRDHFTQARASNTVFYLSSFSFYVFFSILYYFSDSLSFFFIV
jgi:hypothetical protein